MILKFKKIAVLVLLFGSGSAMAGMMGDVQSSGFSSSGVYFGGAIGVSNLTNKVTAFRLPSQLVDPHLGGTGVTGGGLLGYDYSIGDRFKVGLEGYVYGNGNQHVDCLHDFNNTAYTSALSYNWGLRMLPGVEFNQGMTGHIIIGYTNGHFNLADNGALGFLNTNVNRSGFQSGLGLTSKITDNIFVRVEGLYTTYGTQTSNGLTTIGTVSLYTANLNTLEADLVLGYKFG